MWVRVLVLASLLGLTAWNVTRSSALEEAERSYLKRQYAQALALSLEHLQRRPWSRSAALLAARCFSHLDWAQEAEPYYRRAGDLSLDDRQVRAYALVRGNFREQAAQAYEEILRRWPENVTALRRLGAVRVSQSQYAEVEAIAERLIAAPDGAILGYTLKATALHDTKYPDRSIHAYAKVLELDPGLTRMPLPRKQFWESYMNDLLAQGDASEIKRLLPGVLENQDDPDLRLILGKAYRMQGELEQAEAEWERVVRLAPDRAEAWLLIGRSRLQRGATASAIEPLEKAQERSPNWFEPPYSLSLAYRRLGRTTEADQAAARSETLRARAGPPQGGMGAEPVPNPTTPPPTSSRE